MADFWVSGEFWGIIGIVVSAILAYLFNSLLQRKFTLVEKIWSEKYNLLSGINKDLRDMEMILIFTTNMLETMKSGHQKESDSPEEDSKERGKTMVTILRTLTITFTFKNEKLREELKDRMNPGSDPKLDDISFFNAVIDIMEEESNIRYFDIYQLASKVDLLLFDNKLKSNIVKAADVLDALISRSRNLNESPARIHRDAAMIPNISRMSNIELGRTRIGKISSGNNMQPILEEKENDKTISGQ